MQQNPIEKDFYLKHANTYLLDQIRMRQAQDGLYLNALTMYATGKDSPLCLMRIIKDIFDALGQLNKEKKIPAAGLRVAVTLEDDGHAKFFDIKAYPKYISIILIDSNGMNDLLFAHAIKTNKVLKQCFQNIYLFWNGRKMQHSLRACKIFALYYLKLISKIPNVHEFLFTKKCTKNPNEKRVKRFKLYLPNNFEGSPNLEKLFAPMQSVKFFVKYPLLTKRLESKLRIQAQCSKSIGVVAKKQNRKIDELKGKYNNRLRQFYKKSSPGKSSGFNAAEFKENLANYYVSNIHAAFVAYYARQNKKAKLLEYLAAIPSFELFTQEPLAMSIKNNIMA